MLINVQQSIFSEIADFLVSRPTLDDLAAYRVSEGIQQHLDDLLERNREEGLSPQDRRDLEKLLTVIQLMDLAKAKALLKLAGKT
jgi:hypothetical protein